MLVNPEIVELSKKTEVGEEGCLSFPKMYAPVERSTGVKVKAQDIKGKDITLELNDPWIVRSRLPLLRSLFVVVAVAWLALDSCLYIM